MSADSLVQKDSFSRSDVIIPSLQGNEIYDLGMKKRGVRFNGDRMTPNTAPWVAQRLDDPDPHVVRGILMAWVHPKRQSEVTDDEVERIRSLLDKEAVAAISEMSEPKKYIRGRHDGKQLDLDLIIGTLDDRQNFRVKALLDSGCTGSCVDTKWVKRNNINTRKLPLPIPVYNADGSENAAGAITDVVELFVRHKGHTERLEFAVTDLGNSDMFLGFEWLKRHNPEVDWVSGKVEFTRCPLECTPLIHGDPESEDIEFEDVADGERILCVDIQREIRVRAFQTTASKVAEEIHKAKNPKKFEETMTSGTSFPKNLLMKCHRTDHGTMQSN